MGIRGELFSTQFNSSTERRSYFFNVKENRRGDIYLTLVESKKSETGAGYERHQLVLFEDDFDRFVRELNKAIEYTKDDSFKKSRKENKHEEFASDEAAPKKVAFFKRHDK